MELSRECRPSYQLLTSSYSPLSAKSRLYSIPARTSSSCASSVPVVASFHHASLDAFSAGARRCSKEVIKLSTWVISNLSLCKPASSRPGRPACLACHPRSEEHTSELQSPCNLVCRLLLEK